MPLSLLYEELPEDAVIVWTSGTAVSAFNGESWADADLYFTDYNECSVLDLFDLDITKEELETLASSLKREYFSTIAVTTEDGTVSMKEYYPLFDPDRVVSFNGASIDDNGVCLILLRGNR